MIDSRANRIGAGFSMTRHCIVFAFCICLGCAGLSKQEVTSDRLPGEMPDESGMFTGVTRDISATFRTAMGRGPNESAAQEEFQAAMQTYRAATNQEGSASRRTFDTAGKAFQDAAVRWPNSAIEEDAMFYRAECAFFADRYPRAQIIFSELVAKYPATRYQDKVSQRRFQIAKYWLDHYEQDRTLAIAPNFTARDRPTFDKFGNAIKLLERIRLDDPTGELADDATMLAAEVCFREGKFYRADELLDDLRRSFPNSSYQYAAHKLGLKAKIQLYQGPHYDPGPLDAAEKIVRQMRHQFPREAREDDEMLTSIYKDIRMNRAVREMTLAQYRDSRQEYRAARARYERVIREFEDTSLARDAEMRLAQLDGRPDLPPQRLQALARVFPTTSDDQPLIATKPDTNRR